MYVDTEYLTLVTLSENNTLSQRQLSKILGISLGSVNMLLARMQRDGFIKIKNLSPCKVIYMLTPEGITEKAKRTLKYVIQNYKYINETKEKIKDYLKGRLDVEDYIYFIADDTEMSQMIIMAANEIGGMDRLTVIRNISDAEEGSLVITLKDEGKKEHKKARMEIVLEKI